MTWDLILGILFLATGGGLILWEALQISSGLESRRWPKAPGTVLHFRREQTRGFVSEGHEFIYRYNLLCRYQVGGTEFLCSRLCFGFNPSWWAAPLTVFSRPAKKYAPGEEIRVAYNPHKPAESVLEPGFSVGMVTMLLFGGFFFAMGILWLRQALGAG